MEAVCNASPLITLAKADLLEILPKLFSRIVVPQAVVKELRAGPESDPIRQRIDTLTWLEQVVLDPPITSLTGVQLGKGESEVIEWAVAHNETIAILDDRVARRAARGVGVRTCGTLGLLSSVARKGIIPSFAEATQRIRDAGLYLDERVIKAVRQQLGE
jgi:predicted nucleic acid-binding protein